MVRIKGALGNREKKEVLLKSHLCKSPGVTHSQTSLATYLEATWIKT